MERIEDILSLVDEILDTRSKRHVVGGVLMSVSLLFGGLAVTVVTLKEDKKIWEIVSKKQSYLPQERH